MGITAASCAVERQVKERLRECKVECVRKRTNRDTRMTTLLTIVIPVSMGTRTICDEVKTVSMDLEA